MNEEKLWELGDLIREARERRKPKMSQEELGRSVSISRPMVSMLERGQIKYPRIGMLSGIAKVLDIPPSSLLSILGISSEDAAPGELHWLASLPPRHISKLAIMFPPCECRRVAPAERPHSKGTPMILVAILLPPLAVLLCKKPFQAILNILLTLCFWIPGMIHAIFVVQNYNAAKRHREMMLAMANRPHATQFPTTPTGSSSEPLLPPEIVPADIPQSPY